jgi:hypothetical protein
VLSFAAGLASSTATGCRIPEFQQTTSISINHDGRMRVQSLSTGDLLHAAGSPTCSPDAGQPFSRSGRQQLLDKQNKLTCIDCEDEITFSRKSDSDRHRRLKHAHGDRLRFVCSAQGCFRGQAPWSFARSDKLTSHIKNTHNLDTIFSHCPVKHCSYGPCTLEVLGVHIQHMHRTHKESRGVLNATSCKALRCPLWRCRKHVSAKKLLNHVASHAKEDIEAAKPNLELSGLLVHLTRGYNVTIQSAQSATPYAPTSRISRDTWQHHTSTRHNQVAKSTSKSGRLTLGKTGHSMPSNQSTYVYPGPLLEASTYTRKITPLRVHRAHSPSLALEVMALIKKTRNGRSTSITSVYCVQRLKSSKNFILTGCRS